MNMGGVFLPTHIHFSKVQAISLQKVFELPGCKVERSEDGRKGDAKRFHNQ